MNDRIELRFLFVGLLLIIGLIARGRKIQFPLRLSLVLRKVFIFSCCFILLTFILSLFGIYFQGYWTTKTIIWTFVFIASLYYSFGNRQTFTKPWQTFAGITFYLPVITIAFLFIPTYIGNILSYAMWIRLTGDTKAIYYNDINSRIQINCTDCDAGFAGGLRYFRKTGVFEIDEGELKMYYHQYENKFKVEKTNDSVIVYLDYRNEAPGRFAFKK